MITTPLTTTGASSVEPSNQFGILRGSWIGQLEIYTFSPLKTQMAMENHHF